MRRQRIIGPSFPFLVTPISAGGGGGTLKTGLVAFYSCETLAPMASDVVTGPNLAVATFDPDIFTLGTGLIGNCITSVSGATYNYSTGAPGAPVSPVAWSGTWAVTAWVNNANLSVGGYPIAARAGTLCWGIYFNASTNHFMVFCGPSSGDQFDVANPKTAGQWCFLYIAYDNVSFHNVYFRVHDGTMQTTGITDAIVSDSSPLQTGAANVTDFVGSYDLIGVWNRLLTPTEIDQLYNGGAGLAYSAM